MMKNNAQEKIVLKLDNLNADFAAVEGRHFSHFYCPILLRDEDSELCLGHIVNDEIPNSCRTTIVQRKDVDGFYGSLFESNFIKAFKANNPTAYDVVKSPQLRRDIPWHVQIDGKTVPHYPLKRDKAHHHQGVALEVGDGQFFDVALKISQEELESAKQTQIVVERNYIPDYTATMLKTAHLSLFHVLGYRYVFGVAGQWLAGILRKFYLKNYEVDRKIQEEAGKEYFANHSGMIVPLRGYDEEILRGSIEDQRFIACVGSSGSIYSLGVLIRTDKSMHIVFMPPENAEHMDTYCNLTKNIREKEFRYLIMEFSRGNDQERPCWRVYDQESVKFVS
jgi:hypothetical protein